MAAATFNDGMTGSKLAHCLGWLAGQLRVAAHPMPSRDSRASTSASSPSGLTWGGGT